MNLSREKLNELVNAIIELDVESAPRKCEELIREGVDLKEIFKAVGEAMDAVGDRYERGEYFLSELIMAGEVVKQVLRVVEPLYKASEGGYLGKVVLASVKGDLHDIGKNIVAMLLKSAGFKVIDLGVDVPAERIIEAIRRENAQILGLSALLTTTVVEMKNVIEELERSGLRSRVKVILGGSAVNEEIAREYGADAFARTAVEGVKICKSWVK